MSQQDNGHEQTMTAVIGGLDGYRFVNAGQDVMREQGPVVDDRVIAGLDAP